MIRKLAVAAFAVSMVLAPSMTMAQSAAPTKTAQKSVPTPKAGKDEKVCSYRFSTGELRKWVCKKELPCCAWDAISYVKCGSTITGCL
jgi:hypothetical protein